MVNSLEDLLDSWVKTAVPEWPDLKRDAFCRRLGWRGAPIPTLQEIGDTLGVTRQSASEAEKRLIDRLHSTRCPASAGIEAAVSLISENVPARADGAAEYLARTGFVLGQITVAGILKAADLADVPHLLAILDGYVCESESGPPPVELAFRLIRKVSRSSGVCSLTSSLAEIGWADVWDPEDLARDLEDSGTAEILVFPWVRASVDFSTRNALINLVRRMLSVTPSVDVSDIRVAVRRRVRSGRMPFAPPARVIASYFGSHPAFDIENRTVSSKTELRPEDELGATDLFIFHQLSEASGGYLSRTELTSVARTDGISAHAIAFALASSPILQHVGRNRWALVGRHAPASPGISDRTAIAATHEWDVGGRLVLAAVVMSPITDRMPLPNGARPFLRQGRYECLPGFALVVEGGYVSGLSTIRAMSKAIAGDTVAVAFNISDGTCSLSVLEKES